MFCSSSTTSTRVAAVVTGGSLLCQPAVPDTVSRPAGPDTGRPAVPDTVSVWEVAATRLRRRCAFPEKNARCLRRQGPAITTRPESTGTREPDDTQQFFRIA